jgi:lysophospholipase L1-like esterase
VAVSLLALTAACGSEPHPRTVARKEIKTQPQLTSLRVVTLGDSLAYGAGDENHSGIAGRLDDELRLRGIRSVETVNHGVNGAQTADLLNRLGQERLRKSIASADAIVLSIGANDLFRTPGAREETLRNPLVVASRILDRIDAIVRELHQINPGARILILGGYNPVPKHAYTATINQLIPMWDATVAGRFENDPRVSIVPMYDVVSPDRLSRYDSFHPGGAAYAEAAKRIAEILVTPPHLERAQQPEGSTGALAAP